MNNILLPWVMMPEYSNTIVSQYSRKTVDGRMVGLIAHRHTKCAIECGYKIYAFDFSGRAILLANSFIIPGSLSEAKSIADDGLVKVGYRLLEHNDKLMVLL